jgi:hypothetical protein
MNIYTSPANWNQQYTTPEQFIEELQEDGNEYEGVEFSLVQMTVQGCTKFKIVDGNHVVIGHTAPIGVEGR